ncbi:hypothetical protein BAUCODRAFT_114873 [Baudoinia panamericana UAMH 10762]|uniref:GDS1 winged helix domain-containing protein n=1 Tax=Baudoinia panamericana (strain UAMH 10762) TaxID=717646 RepID=M2MN60_BAUPA|nr:uncharacterized protein BAUCODRAFT_114873 [Baudoinia panamericana UAMH 10762]EMC92883.1 hypothetical protein BAUCODRAFT_114873 [Baudoinia panamericana UAMH 10762]
MPYNTRRKSLSLSELGIIVPKRSRAISHPSPPSTVGEGDEPPVKRWKRSHGSSSPPPGTLDLPRVTTIRFKEEKPKRATELSPPPSPAVEGNNKVDTEGIKDDIVVATIQQLEKTGNRPHLVKELAYVLASSLHCVEKSANPAALISSRLTAYLHRSWPTISPCPLAKDLSPVHPRRLYFYLTTTPHQPIPEVAEPIPEPKRIISPSLSSASAADEEDYERYSRQRAAMSPSPEVDLSSPELEDESVNQPPSPGQSFSARNSVPRGSRSSSLSHQKRAPSPQLEREERDFKQTASQLYEQALLRRNSQQLDVSMEDTDAVPGAAPDFADASPSIEESEEVVARKNSDDAAALFGHIDHLKLPLAQLPMDFSSPVIQPQSLPQLETGASSRKLERNGDIIEHIPENIELDELEDMFDAY